MPLTPGTRLGSYDIAARIGVGGMGEVYRARDTNLGRDVAIKVLPDLFAHDPERLARFEREAHVLASLNHPNIAVIHDLKEVEGSKYLILELVEGDTLAERIARGPLPLDEALDIALQIAGALETAHERGIVHRDLKPANVKVTPEGRVKVLDFGLAKIYESPNTSPDVSHSPTLSAMHTGGGMILGTAAYMSPEQARGRTVDRRGDIWAFGCVLFEMLTGRQTFPSEETVSDTLAGILKEEPGWNALPNDTPSKIRTLLERCLRKDVRRRLPDIAEARIEIEEARIEPRLAAREPIVVQRRRYAWPAVAVVSLLAAAALAVWIVLAPSPEADVVRFDVFAPEGAIPLVIDGRKIEVGEPLSPDGRTLAFVASTAGKRVIWVRSLDSTTARPLPGTEDAGRPVWSPDSQYIAFVAQGRLRKVAAAGGPPSQISNEAGRDLAWGAANVILTGGQGKPLLVVPAAGGQPTPVTELGAKETTHDYPAFLPDGRHFIYMARHGGADPEEDWDLFVGSLDSKERKLLPGIHAAVRYSPTGHLLFIRDGTLMAHPFNLNRLELTGEAFLVAEAVAFGPRARARHPRPGRRERLDQPVRVRHGRRFRAGLVAGRANDRVCLESRPRWKRRSAQHRRWQPLLARGRRRRSGQVAVQDRCRENPSRLVARRPLSRLHIAQRRVGAPVASVRRPKASAGSKGPVQRDLLNPLNQ
jgi:hypothetical protein